VTVSARLTGETSSLKCAPWGVGGPKCKSKGKKKGAPAKTKGGGTGGIKGEKAREVIWELEMEFHAGREDADQIRVQGPALRF